MKNNLRELREKKGLSQEALARALGVSRQTILNIEHNEQYNPSVVIAIKLSQTLGVKVEKLFVAK